MLDNFEFNNCFPPYSTKIQNTIIVLDMIFINAIIATFLVCNIALIDDKDINDEVHDLLLK